MSQMEPYSLLSALLLFPILGIWGLFGMHPMYQFSAVQKQTKKVLPRRGSIDSDSLYFRRKVPY